MPIIEVDHVTKEYRLGQLTSLKQTLQGMAARLAGRPKPPSREPFKALDDVSFTVERGEVVGIIGVNGAGKSTLLKLISRITVPTKGRITVRGSIAPLIEVGAGLHPELTGRENVYLNASILGIPRNIIHKKLDEIIEFAEIEEFVDTPIKRYSSGMKVRLGFAIATSVDADILIVDEVLAVGDLAFQRKCFDKMEEMIRVSGRTVLIVSHNIRQVQRMCSRVMLLGDGKILAAGEPSQVCNRYYQASIDRVFNNIQAGSRSVYGSGELELKSVFVYNSTSHEPSDEVEMHTGITVGVHLTAKTLLKDVEVVVGFHTTDFIYIAAASTNDAGVLVNLQEGDNYLECTLDDLPLMPGVYGVRVAILDKYSRPIWYGENLRQFRVNSSGIDRNKKPVLSMVDLNFRWQVNPKQMSIRSQDECSAAE